MQIAPLPPNETARLARLRSLGILDTLPQQAYDDISALAMAICKTPMAYIGFIDADREWLKARNGLDVVEAPRDITLCAHAILEPDRVMVVEDTLQDPRFADNPMVTGDLGLRFYAGAPIVTSDGMAVGTVCVIDRTRRQLDPVQVDALRKLSGLVSTLLEHERSRQAEAHAEAVSAHQRNEQLVAMITAGLDAQAYIDRDLIYRHANQRYLEYHGASTEQVIGCSVLQLLEHDPGVGLVVDNLRQALLGKPVHYQRLGHYKGSGDRHVEVAMLPVFDDTGTVTGVVKRVHDIENLKRNEAQLRDTISLLERKTLEQQRFIQVISHDLREPINSINNFSSLLTTDHAPGWPAEAQRYLQFVNQGGARISQLLDDLLRYVRMDKHRVEFGDVDTGLLAQQVRDDLTAALQRTGGQIDIGPMPVVRGDASLLRLLLQNLVENGLKFTRPGQKPHVRLSHEAHPDHWLIRVEDDGIGIPPEHHSAVFDMFKRLHNRKVYAGSGLGLSICRRIADMHGGRLLLESEPDHGCRFNLQLQRQPDTAQP